MTPRSPRLDTKSLGPLEPFLEMVAQRVADIVVERLRDDGAPAVPTLLNKQQLAAALGVSVATIDRYLRAGVIAPTLRLGPDGPQRFELARVRAALEEATKVGPAPPKPVDAPPRLLRRRTRS